MVEGGETPGGEPGAGGGGVRRGEGDLLAERRARRAAESGEHALARRAEVAEATVRTLESHVFSLQQRLHEAEEERRRVSELIAAERSSLARGLAPEGSPAPPAAPAAEVSERELRRLQQREYAEQRLRADAEDRLIDAEREARAELERLRRRLGESEADARALTERIESLRRELAEAEQDAAADRSAARRAEEALQARVEELESRAAQLERALDAERAARQRLESLLAQARSGHRRAQALAAELAGLAASVRAGAAEPAAAEPRAAAPESASGASWPAPVGGFADMPLQARPASRALGEAPGALERLAQRPPNEEMIRALAEAVQRLRARVAEGAAPAPTPQQARAVAPPASAPPERGESSPGAAAPLSASASARAPRPRRASTHKHSYSLIARWRIARKQRRGR